MFLYRYKYSIMADTALLSRLDYRQKTKGLALSQSFFLTVPDVNVDRTSHKVADTTAAFHLYYENGLLSTDHSSTES
jgi:hypothetical protein